MPLDTLEEQKSSLHGTFKLGVTKLRAADHGTCGTHIKKKPKKRWFFKTFNYKNCDKILFTNIKKNF